MLLAFDIGNTNIVAGCFSGPELLCEFRLKTDTGRTIDEYAALLFPLIERKLGCDLKFSQCLISSVVPPLTQDICALVSRDLAISPLVVGPGIKTGVAIKTAEPAAVGADRIVNSVAVKELFGVPALVVDFGTATTFDFVSRSGSYEGGVIVPGVQISLDGLVRNTAKLPKVELSWPETVIGKSTVAAMQSGSVIGYTCMVDGLIDRITAEVGEVAHIIATGGLGSLFAKHSKRIRGYEPHLTLHGLRIIAELNA